MMLSLTLLQLLRWSLLLGFVFLIAVGIWALFTITRMQREQAIALTMLRVMAVKIGMLDVNGVASHGTANREGE